MTDTNKELDCSCSCHSIISSVINCIRCKKELAFIDLVQYVQGLTGLGYNESAQIVDKAIEPQVRDRLLAFIERVDKEVIESDQDPYEFGFKPMYALFAITRNTLRDEQRKQLAELKKEVDV